MDRREFLHGAGALALLPLSGAWRADRASGVRTATAAGIAPDGTAPDAYGPLLEAVLRRSPETATALGLDAGARAALKHRLDDRSGANRLRYYRALLDAAPALRARPAANERDALFRAAALWMADAIAPFATFGYGAVDGFAYPCPYPVSQLTGAYQSVPDFLASQHAIATRDDAVAYLDRLAALATMVAAESEVVRADAARGAIPPAVLIDRALTQLEAFQRDQHGAGAGLVTSVVERTRASKIAGDWGARAQAIVDGPLARAIAAQATLLRSLRARARERVGVDAMPQGDAFYAACLRFHTYSSLAPEAAHALGVEQVAAISARARDVLDAAGVRQGTVAEGIKALWTDPAQLFPNTDAGRADLLAFIEQCVTDITARLPRAFSHLPKTPLVVRRVPVANELGSPSAYALSGSVDGTRPGAIYFNLRDTGNWARWAIPTTAYHEGLPGHHLQGSIANEATDIPTLFKLLSSNAYTEGWALYTEQLADELGAYESLPLGRLGMLQASLFRACRIVVDTGLHARGWSREKAIAYLIENAGSTPDDARREIERYCAWPGQACGYKIGHLEFVKQRERARARLGAKFDLKGFHDAVLDAGSVPLEVMAQAVDQWMARAGG